LNFLKRLFGKTEAAAGSAPAPKPKSEPVRIAEILPEQLKARLDNNDELVVVDMRQKWEYQAGHIPGAINMFVQEIPARINELPTDRDIVLQCWHGNTSLGAAAYLIEQGRPAHRVLSLNGGIAGWTSAFGQKGLSKQ